MLFGGMAKQIVIVMPVALTLLDVWPLGRTTWDRLWRDIARLTAEKWAFWLLAIAYAGVPIWTHIGEKAFVEVPLFHRLAMIPIHYLFYFQKLVWPTALAPLQADLPLIGWKLGAGTGVLVFATAFLWRIRAKAPWALWGWLWFVGLLFPLIGVVWAGSERVAVRFLYLPQMGLTLAVVLAGAALGRRWGTGGQGGRILLAVALLFSCGTTLRTLSYWRDPNTFGLWIWDCHPQEGSACAMGGDALMALGEWGEAQKVFEHGVALGNKACFLKLGMLLSQLGQTERTAGILDKLEKKTGRPLGQIVEWERPQDRELFWRLQGQVLLARGNHEGAIAALKEAVHWEADSGAFVLAEYLRACHEGGRPEEGAEVAARLAEATGICVREWRNLFPCYAEIWKKGARGYAYVYFADYAQRHPEDGVILNYMAWLLATATPDRLEHARMGEWPQAAVRWAELALESDKETPAGVWQVLAAARANAGDSSGAVRAAEKARDMAREEEDEDLVAQLEKQIITFRMGLAWRE
jgi:tetratricopeptide (TPR) repeat protein